MIKMEIRVLKLIFSYHKTAIRIKFYSLSVIKIIGKLLCGEIFRKVGKF